MIYGSRTNGKAHGVVNTKSVVVDKMLDIAGYVADRDLSEIKVLEPACGEGAFVEAIIERLFLSSLQFDFDFEQALANLCFCELNEEIVHVLKQKIDRKLKLLGANSGYIQIIKGDFLQINLPNKFDLIIGNPPYVRHENIPNDLKRIYQNKYFTFSHRSDLYIPFYEKSLAALQTNGVLSFICSNRWLKNQYGKKLRQLITQHYSFDLIIDLEEVDVFEEEVLGYPAVTNIVKRSNDQTANYYKITDLASFLTFNVTQNISSLLYLNAVDWFREMYVKSAYTKKLKSIEQQHFKIGIGVATGRDSIFISDDFNHKIEDELLIPILTNKDLKGQKIEWTGQHIISPFDKYGNLINLESYPAVRTYFNLHKTDLLNRYVAKKNPTKWYRTIDKIDLTLLTKSKVLLPDISKNRFIHVDKGDFYPHHNLYYIVGGNYEQMCLLAAILMSDFVYEQLLCVGNKMKGGYPRWQAQHLKKLLLPPVNHLPTLVKNNLLIAYQNADLDAINKLINHKTIL